MSQNLEVIEVATTPFLDQKPGTSGLRKQVKVFSQDNYIENFVQATLNTFKDKVKGCTLVVGGDGRYLLNEAVQKIIAIAAGNGVGKLMIGANGLMSTPAISACIRKYSTAGGIILTASHNPGGPNGDFGIKFNVLNGGPAPDMVTNAIYEQTKVLSIYKSVKGLPESIDLSKPRIYEYQVNGAKFLVQIIDSTSDYVALMKSIFNFEKLKKLLSSGKFKILLNCLSGITGPYANKIFIDELGASPDSVVNAIPLPDFGGHHPDPNLTYAKELVDDLKKGVHDFGAAFDGDGDRNMILGKNAFFVTPSDSLAIIADNTDSIPFFVTSGLKGFARSMPTAGAIDRVAKKKNVQLFEVPTGWKYFGNLMDAGRLSLCGEESFGTGSDHIREKDGIWAALAFLSVLADQESPSVESLTKSHWAKYGRNYFTRYDYENCDTDKANQVMQLLESIISEEKFPNSTYTKGGKTFVGALSDNFSYNDVVDGTTATGQGKRFIFQDGSRIVFRISGTGSSGATIRMYCDFYEDRKEFMSVDTPKAMKPLVDLALELSNIHALTGRDGPSVIT